MRLHQITAAAQDRRPARKRVGRGESSGRGKTCGRGHKGAGQRAGTTGTSRHEGGRVPYFRRIPKRGFSNFRFRAEFQIVNLGELEERFDAGQLVDPAALAAKRLVADAKGPVKILGNGTLTKSLTVKAHKFSVAAKEAIQAAGGAPEVLA